jgi:hypothetical protein
MCRGRMQGQPSDGGDGSNGRRGRGRGHVSAVFLTLFHVHMVFVSSLCVLTEVAMKISQIFLDQTIRFQRNDRCTTINGRKATDEIIVLNTSF